MSFHRAGWLLFPVLLVGVALAADSKEPAIKTTAEKFALEVLSNPKDFDKSFKGKLIEITGTVSTAEPTYSPYGLTVAGGKLKPADNFGIFIECEVPKEDREKTWLLALKQKVKVVGEAKEINGNNVRLTNCLVTELEPNPLATVKAADLAAAYAKKDEKLMAKYGSTYDHKEFFLEGKVKKAQAMEYGYFVYLDVPAKPGVKVQVSKAEGEAMKEGDALKLKVMGWGMRDNEDVVFSQGHVLSKPLEKK